jgi:septum site-determining protein MinD
MMTADNLPDGNKKRARVITVTSGKGGVGKTTTTANLGVALAKNGFKVCLMDTDIGLRNLDVVMGLENRIVYDLVDIVEGKCKLRQAMIKHKQFEELYLIPAAQTRDKTAVSPSNMVEITNKLREEFDYILIDSPAGIERGFRNALAPADDVLIVTNPEVSAVRDADRVVGLIEAANRGPARLILNRMKAGMVGKGDMLSAEDVTDILSIQIIGIVPDDDAVIPAANRGTPVVLNEKSRAGQAFNNIARRLTGEKVPFVPLENTGGFFSRVVSLFGGGKNNS